MRSKHHKSTGTFRRCAAAQRQRSQAGPQREGRRVPVYSSPSAHKAPHPLPAFSWDETCTVKTPTPPTKSNTRRGFRRGNVHINVDPPFVRAAGAARVDRAHLGGALRPRPATPPPPRGPWPSIKTAPAFPCDASIVDESDRAVGPERHVATHLPGVPSLHGRGQVRCRGWAAKGKTACTSNSPMCLRI